MPIAATSSMDPVGGRRARAMTSPAMVDQMGAAVTAIPPPASVTMRVRSPP